MMRVFLLASATQPDQTLLLKEHVSPWVEVVLSVMGNRRTGAFQTVLCLGPQGR
jgi:hypothetical protein